MMEYCQRGYRSGMASECRFDLTGLHFGVSKLFLFFFWERRSSSKYLQVNTLSHEAVLGHISIISVQDDLERLAR
jgi:hypothetical protein